MPFSLGEKQPWGGKLENTQDKAIKEHGQAVLGEVFEDFSDRLLRMIEFRLDRRLSGRVEPEDVLQEAYIETSRRLDDFLSRPDVSFYVWVRQITWQCLIAVQRRHFGEKRSPRKEVRYGAGGGGQSQATFSIARRLVGQMTSPSRVAMREEQIQSLRLALDGMDDMDREVLALRHFEHMTNTEVAETLNLSPSAASNRHVRALARLGEILSQMEEFDSKTD